MDRYCGLKEKDVEVCGHESSVSTGVKRPGMNLWV